MARLVETFRNIRGEQLRLVATFGAIDYEIEFVREDLERAFEETERDRAYRSLMANQATSDDFRKIGEFGALECQIFIFEELIAFQFPSSRYESIFVSYDRVDQFPILEVVDAAADIPHLTRGDRFPNATGGDAD